METVQRPSLHNGSVPSSILWNAVPRRTPKDLVKNRVEGHIERSAATDTKGFGTSSAATDTREVKRSAATDTKGS